VYIEAIKRAGITVHLPCVNRSDEVFTAEEDGIRTGLEAIASLNEGFRAALLADRARRGPFRDLADFRRRVNPGPEALTLRIRCGALDFTEKTRPALFLEADLEKVAARTGDGVPSTEYSVPSTEYPVLSTRYSVLST